MKRDDISMDCSESLFVIFALLLQEVFSIATSTDEPVVFARSP